MVVVWLPHRRGVLAAAADRVPGERTQHVLAPLLPQGHRPRTETQVRHQTRRRRLRGKGGGRARIALGTLCFVRVLTALQILCPNTGGEAWYNDYGFTECKLMYAGPRPKVFGLDSL